MGPECDERAVVPSEAGVVRGGVRADHRLVLVYESALRGCAHAETDPWAQAIVRSVARAQLSSRDGLGDEERAGGSGAAAQVRRALDQDRPHPAGPDPGDRNATRCLLA